MALSPVVMLLLANSCSPNALSLSFPFIIFLPAPLPHSSCLELSYCLFASYLFGRHITQCPWKHCPPRTPLFQELAHLFI